MTTTQMKLTVLQEVAEDNATLDRMLDKLLHVIQEQYQQRLAHYAAALNAFEQRYQMSSLVFHGQFEAGALGDDMDFFEWSGLYELWHDLRQKLDLLESAHAQRG